MKGKSLVLLLVVLLLSLPSMPAYADTRAGLVLDDELIETELSPINKNGSILVPMRVIFEALGAEVSYEAANKKITGRHGDLEIVMTVGSTEARRNGEKLTLQQSPELLGNHVYVPVRFVSEALGAKVTWNAERQAVEVASETVGLVYKEQLPVFDQSGKHFVMHHSGDVRLKWSLADEGIAGGYITAAAGPDDTVWLKSSNELLVVDHAGEVVRRQPSDVLDSTYIMAGANGNGYDYTFLDEDHVHHLSDVYLAMANLFDGSSGAKFPVLAIQDHEGHLIVQSDKGLEAFDAGGRQVWLVPQEVLGLNAADDEDHIWSISIDEQRWMYLDLYNHLIILDDNREVIYKADHDWGFPEILPEGMMMSRGSIYRLENGAYTLVASPSGGEAGSGFRYSEEAGDRFDRLDPSTGDILWSYQMNKEPTGTRWDEFGLFADEAENIYALTHSASLYGLHDTGVLRFKIDSPDPYLNSMNVVPLSSKTFLVIINHVILCFEYV